MCEFGALRHHNYRRKTKSRLVCHFFCLFHALPRGLQGEQEFRETAGPLKGIDVLTMLASAEEEEEFL